eukprot:g21995.t1
MTEHEPAAQPPDDASGPKSEEIRHSQVAAIVPEHVARGIFSTGAVVVQGNHEFIVDFLLRMNAPQQLAARVVMPPAVVGQLIVALQQNVQNYETKFGPTADPRPQGEQQPQEQTSARDLYEQLKLPDDVLSGRYANAVVIGHSATDFCFDFITTFFPRSAVSCRVYLAAPNAKRFLDSLKHSFAQFQRKLAERNQPQSPPPPTDSDDAPGRLGAMSANILFAAVLIGMLELAWRDALYLLALVGLLHGCTFLFAFREYPGRHPWVNPAEAALIDPQSAARSRTSDRPDGESEADAEPPKKPRMSFSEMLRQMSPRSILNLFCISLTSTLSTIADNIYSSWIPLFLAETHGLKFKEMGFYSALPLLGGACGGAYGGYLNDRLMGRWKNRRWVRSGIGAFGKGTAGVLIVAALLTSYDNPYRFCIFLFFVKFFADIGLATRWGTVSDVGGKATASVFGFNNAIACIGAVLAPLLYGYVADHYNWLTVFVIGGVMYGLCALSWLLINSTIPLLRDDAEPEVRGTE